jgi:hypothetical protein
LQMFCRFDRERRAQRSQELLVGWIHVRPAQMA